MRVGSGFREVLGEGDSEKLSLKGKKAGGVRPEEQVWAAGRGWMGCGGRGLVSRGPQKA